MSDDFSGSGDSGYSSPDSYRETSTEGWLQRIGGSFIAALIGLLLVPAAIVLLYWNEGRVVRAMQALNHGAAAVQEVSATAVDAQYNGKLVHITGSMQPTTPAQDPIFGVTGQGLIRLSRSVEMYQWQQQSHSSSHNNLGGSKTTDTEYTYERIWSDQAINSGAFKVPGGHQNPPKSLSAATFDAPEVKLGAYKIDPSLLNKVSVFTPLTATGTPPAGYQQSGQGYYRGNDPNQPAIGDMRVTFTAVPAQTMSVVAAQSSGALTAYRDSNGYTIALAEPGDVPASALFHDQQQSEHTLTWILRGVGFVVVLIGFVLMTRPLTMLFAVIPFLETLVGAGAFLVALSLAVPVTLITIAVAWIAHRPLIGVGLLIAAAVAMYLLRQMMPKRAAPVSAPVSPPANPPSAPPPSLWTHPTG